MPSLFDDGTEKTQVKTGAIISACGQYRYHLWRQWNASLACMCWLMLNPSSADDKEDDPTIRKCIGFAKRHDCGGISVRNVFALRATDPTGLLRHPDPFGPENEDYLMSARNVSLLTILVLGWGTKKGGKRLAHHYKRAENACVIQKPYCFGVTKDGDPGHPLYLPYDSPKMEWSLPT
jgi:hypothetical protein